MTITSLLAFIAMHKIWKWSLFISFSITALFLTIDLSFLGSNLTKIASGGWFPLLVGLGGLLMMTTWKNGRRLLAIQLAKISLPINTIIADFNSKKYHKVTGTAVYMTGNPELTPPALVENLKHNKVFHEQIIILSINILQTPRLNFEKRVSLEKLTDHFYRLTAYYGFMEQVDVTKLMNNFKRNRHILIDLNETSYILGRETLIADKSIGMNIWQDKLFMFMSKNSQSATTYFKVPPKHVFEIGSQVEI